MIEKSTSNVILQLVTNNFVAIIVMQLKKISILTCLILFSVTATCQYNIKPAITQDKKDSIPTKHGITFITYFQMLKGNLIQQAASPLQLKRSEALSTAGFAAATLAVMRLDKTINKGFINLHNSSNIVKNAGPQVTKFGGRYALFTMIGIGSYSYIAGNEKLKNATLLATQSYLTSGLWVSVFKFISGRERPAYYDPVTGINEGRWHGPLFQFRKDITGNKPDGARYSSFTSGHVAAAFSIGTVYAEMYRDRPLVPILSFAGATVISLSRMTENRHWASDVLVSSALGYICGRQVVRNFHRLNRLNSILTKNKNLLTFDVRYMHNTIMPAFTYTFR